MALQATSPDIPLQKPIKIQTKNKTKRTKQKPKQRTKEGLGSGEVALWVKEFQQRTTKKKQNKTREVLGEMVPFGPHLTLDLASPSRRRKPPKKPQYRKIKHIYIYIYLLPGHLPAIFGVLWGTCLSFLCLVWNTLFCSVFGRGLWILLLWSSLKQQEQRKTTQGATRRRTRRRTPSRTKVRKQEARNTRLNNKKKEWENNNKRKDQQAKLENKEQQGKITTRRKQNREQHAQEQEEQTK